MLVEKKVTPGSEIESNLQSLVQTRSGGDPDDEKIRFTDLTPTRIETELASLKTPASDDLIRRWMDEEGLRLRKIRKLIAGGHSEDLLFDGGGSNSASKYLFKHDLQQLADHTAMTIRVAHYPSYCSKYNPIERRFFPHLSRVCTGMLFDTLQTVVGLIRKAPTATGLRNTVNVIKRLCESRREATDEMKAHIRSTVQFADLLPKWNYTITPQIQQLFRERS